MKIKHIYSKLLCQVFLDCDFFFLKKTYHVSEQCYRCAFIVLTRTAKKNQSASECHCIYFTYYTV